MLPVKQKKKNTVQKVSFEKGEREAVGVGEKPLKDGLRWR